MLQPVVVPGQALVIEAQQMEGGGVELTHSPIGRIPGLEKLPSGPESPPESGSMENSQSQPTKTSKRGQKNTKRGRA